MNLQKLFEMQAKLDADITAHHPVQEDENRLEKKVLALLVELGECANEWRGFKFWSNDQKARTKVEHLCVTCEGKGFVSESYDPDELDEFETCINCNGVGKIGESNPLLEEYVDCLHFILSIGNDTGFAESYAPFISDLLGANVTPLEAFNRTFRSVTRFEAKGSWKGLKDYARMFDDFLLLRNALGFTWKQVEQAYYDKNKVNFERQEQGY